MSEPLQADIEVRMSPEMKQAVDMAEKLIETVANMTLEQLNELRTGMLFLQTHGREKALLEALAKNEATTCRDCHKSVATIALKTDLRTYLICDACAVGLTEPEKLQRDHSTAHDLPLAAAVRASLAAQATAKGEG